jgi:hypothetical protein
MYTNVNLAATLGALALIGTCLLLIVLALVSVYFLIRRRSTTARLTLVAIALIAGIYLAAMLIFAFRSREYLLLRGEEKYFCELDCHLAYSLTAVSETTTLGEGRDLITAAGVFRIVTIKTRFDETTIGSTRGDGLLYPNARVVTISDANGKQYFPVPKAQAALEKSHVAGTAMTVPLRPGDSYTTSLVFDLPAEFKAGTLLIQEGELTTRFVIGHENGLFHKKTRFRI